MTQELDSRELENHRKEAKQRIVCVERSDVRRRCWPNAISVALAIIALPACSACTSFDRADLLDGELFVSEGNKHTVSLDSDEIYSFQIKFGANMQIYDAVDERNFKRQQRLRLSRLEEQE